MEIQEAYDTMVGHLRVQGKAATDTETEMCHYRLVEDSGNVLMCAVGVLIPDELYDDTMEGKSAEDILSENARVYDALSLSDCNDDNAMLFYADMQFLHDNHDAKDWEEMFEAFAEKFDLVYKEAS